MAKSYGTIYLCTSHKDAAKQAFDNADYVLVCDRRRTLSKGVKLGTCQACTMEFRAKWLELSKVRNASWVCDKQLRGMGFQAGIALVDAILAHMDELDA